MPSAVLDASALLAYLRDELGADVVADAVATGAAISTVNLGEVLSRVADRGRDPARVVRQMTDRGLLEGAIAVEPFTSADAIEVARLRPLTRDLGLSLGDRACLALAKRLDTPVLTADSAWSKLNPRLEVRQIR
ncbi:MAG TPA: type II toxin-antitoxin system VapC family toxin [Conexibacter sp.]|nr:type II toxin-antitoxin system VapC family toxin [Conexibacter sp.]